MIAIKTFTEDMDGPLPEAEHITTVWEVITNPTNRADWLPGMAKMEKENPEAGPAFLLFNGHEIMLTVDPTIILLPIGDDPQ